METQSIENQTHNIGFKHFRNARHDFKESFMKLSDLVLFGGKFMLDDTKLLVYEHKITKNRTNLFRVGLWVACR